MSTLNIPAALFRFAAYHRDERNIILHMLCLPVLLFSGLFFFNSVFATWEQSITNLLYWLSLCVMTIAYFKFAGLLGLTASILIALICTIGQLLLQWSGTGTTFIAGFTLLALGYSLHRLGHWYEGNYRAIPFALSLLAAAPLYVTARGLKQHSYFKKICATLDEKAGPIYIRDMANPVKSK